jgi:hypothetical protein
VLGYRSVDLSASARHAMVPSSGAHRSTIVVAQKSAAAFPTQSFEPSVVTSGSLIALMFAFSRRLRVGGPVQRTKDPGADPAATYITVASIGICVLTSWIIVGAAGVEAIKGTATEAQATSSSS